jgi:hypothetical protein
VVVANVVPFRSKVQPRKPVGAVTLGRETGRMAGLRLPLTEGSGRTHYVRGRRACAQFVRQSFHECAAHSQPWSLYLCGGALFVL